MAEAKYYWTNNKGGEDKRKPHNKDNNKDKRKEECENRNQLFFCTKAVFSQELTPIPGSQNQFVPAVSINGWHKRGVSGILKLLFSSTFDKVQYKLSIYNVTRDNEVVGAHLHYGKANVNGPVLVTLFERGNCGNSHNGSIKGMITNCNITHFNGGDNSQNQINNVASLYAAIKNGAIYVNIHTEKYPDGAARGQIYFDSKSNQGY